jgi:hypothetical protein|uniref:Uncharacterized protein n=1 Tax=Populus trichocarpa TaxID=3694 RepID=A0A3N7G3C7_POPTR
MWFTRNLLHGNCKNKQAAAELELQGSVDLPELAGLVSERRWTKTPSLQSLLMSRDDASFVSFSKCY